MADDDDELAWKVSREDLYELAWSKPMLDLAKDFGISDVALAKRCRRLAIPVPGRGYWARVDAGQTPYRPKLPKREAQWGDEHALTVQPQQIDQQESAIAEPAAGNSSSFRDRLAGLSISPIESVLDCVPAVKRTARHHRHSRKAELAFDRGERTGPIVSMDVSEGVLDRACLLADQILRACQALGWSFVAPTTRDAEEHQVQRHKQPEPQRIEQTPVGQILVEGERVGLHIEERLREEAREPTAAQLAREKRVYGYHAPRMVQQPTGNLRVIRLDTYRTYGAPQRFTVYDRGNKRVEDQLADILNRTQELALSIKARRAEDERKELERQERERRRKEFEARQEANEALFKQLEIDAGAWHRARYLRRYIRAVRKVLGTKDIPVRLGEQVVDYLEWAETYVDQLDPLGSQPRHPEFTKRASYYVHDLDRIEAEYGRLMGSEWSDAWKLGADYSPDPHTRYYSSKSVFEVDNASEKEE